MPTKLDQTLGETYVEQVVSQTTRHRELVVTVLTAAGPRAATPCG
jgi:hypothetical protein